MKRLLALSALIMLAGCGEAEEKAASPAPPPIPYAAPGAGGPAAEAPPPVAGSVVNLSPMVADMMDCLGAYAVEGKIDPGSVRQNIDSVWFQEFAGMQLYIQTRPDRPTGPQLTGITNERIAHWKSRTAADRKARAEACQTKY